ncbi:hypothetical protein Y032_0199g1668 [Ancylostoma ceylanicum]|uniref:Uncharacterized protein n=1 Tax=Ancylostoma ceylanicum TaxID=53326 RepID=A0A016SNW8_9BILA|nr:hypothetical protein Y032_0199g1668 [Ancylostoma ceylanicum]
MPQKRSTDGRHMRMLFAFMCYALLGTIIFSFLHYETVQNEVAQRRHKLDSLISKFAQKITEAANDPEKQVNVSTMKRYVEFIASPELQNILAGCNAANGAHHGE